MQACGFVFGPDLPGAVVLTSIEVTAFLPRPSDDATALPSKPCSNEEA